MLQETIRIAQISDIHIGPTEAAVQAIDVRANFIMALEAVKGKDLDLLVLSGDIAAEDGEEGAYEWVAKAMVDFPYPWVIMAGNHDRVEVMRRYFSIEKDIRDSKLCFHRIIKGRSLYFLDSSQDILDIGQLEWLVREANSLNDEALLFIHHPPAHCGCLFMDTKYPLRNIDETRAYIRRITNIHNIFVGHYHTEKFIIQDGKNIHLTPSTMMQIDTRTAKFKMEHIRPGWRIIDWAPDRIDTEVHYALETPEGIVPPTMF